MESVNCKNFKTSLVEEDVNLTAFRKRNKILVLVLIWFIICLTLLIGSSIFYLLHNSSDYDQIPLSPAVRAFYSVACNTPSCLDILNPIVTFTLSLQTAAKELENLTSFMLSNSGSDTKSAYKNCSDSLHNGSGQIRDVLATMRVNPFAETLSNEERDEVMIRIITAKGNLKSCLDDLQKVESTAVSEVREKVIRVEMYMSSGGDFLVRYDDVLQKFWSEIAADWRSKILENLVIVCVCVMYLWFIFYLFRALCRLLGVKSPPLANVFGALFTGTAISRRNNDSPEDAR